MKINSIGQNAFFNTMAINKNVNNLNQSSQNGSSLRLGNSDTVTISKQGKKENLIQQLLNQKKLIQENKDMYLKNSLENGYVDQSKIDEYDQQLKSIDEQIAQASIEDATSQEDKSSTYDKKIKTKEEFQQSQMNDIINVSCEINNSDVIMSEKNKMDGQARVLKAEVKNDGPRALASKFEKIAELESKSSDLMNKVGERIAEINDNVSENRQEIIVDEEKDTQQDTQTDEKYDADQQNILDKENL